MAAVKEMVGWQKRRLALLLAGYALFTTTLVVLLVTS